jgi:hypothetical protein
MNGALKLPDFRNMRDGGAQAPQQHYPRPYSYAINVDNHDRPHTCEIEYDCNEYAVKSALES